MQIPQIDIDNAISGIVDFFNRRNKTTLTKLEFLKLQEQSVHNLDGITFSFFGRTKVNPSDNPSKVIHP